LPSPETTVNWTASRAGIEIVGGWTLPPAWIVNVAGTRALVGGGLRLVVVWLEMLEIVVDVAVEPLVTGAPVSVVVTEVDDVVTAVVAVVVDECFEPPHAASSSAVANATERSPKRLTFPA
jgi:hypothetical protein